MPTTVKNIPLTSICYVPVKEDKITLYGTNGVIGGILNGARQDTNRGKIKNRKSKQI